MIVVFSETSVLRVYEKWTLLRIEGFNDLLLQLLFLIILYFKAVKS